MHAKTNPIANDTIKNRILTIRREIQTLSTEESKLFFAGQPAQLMIAMSRMVDLKRELQELERLAEQLNIAV